MSVFLHRSLGGRVEVLGLEDIHVNEVFLHLVELVAADCVNIATLQLLLKNLRHRNLAQVGAHTQEIPVHNELVLIVGELAGGFAFDFLLGGELLGESGDEVSVGTVAHCCLLLYYYILRNY